MGKLGAIPGVFAFLRPMPVLNISTGATNQNQGQYAYSLSGVNSQQVYDVAQKLMARLQQYPGFATISSDYFQSHAESGNQYPARSGPHIWRFGDAHSESSAKCLFAELSLPDQEARGPVSGDPRSQGFGAVQADRSFAAVHQVGRRKKSCAAQRAGHLETIARARRTVNHLNQFTSVTIFFNLKPDVAIGDATDFISKAAAEIVPPTVRASLQGEALTFRDTVRDLTILMALAVFVMYVILAILYESYVHPLTVLSTLPTALVGGLLTLYHFRRAGVALRVRRHVHADGHREEKRNHDRGFRAPARGCGRDGGASHS